MNRFLIFGASGQDGLILANRLSRKGIAFLGVSRTEIGCNKISDYVPGAQTRVLELSDGVGVRNLIAEFEPDRIINLAAESSVATSWEHPTQVFTSNTVGVANILEAIRKNQKANVRFYQASSSEMFGSGRGLSEASVFNPQSPYAISKFAAHQLVRNYRESFGLFVSSGILFNHESPLRPSNFVSRKITSQVAEIHLGRRSKIELGNIKAIRDWGWAPDYVSAMELIIEASAPSDYVVATGIPHTIEDMLSIAFRSIGIEDWSQYVSQSQSLMRPQDLQFSIGNPEKLTNSLGWSPTKNFDEMIFEMVRHDIEVLSSNRGAIGKWQESF